MMTANSRTLLDENGDSPDWIELYNPGASPVSLAGYGLSDDPALPFKWTFRDATIDPGGFLIVFASGKDRQPGMVAPTNPPAIAGLKAGVGHDVDPAGTSAGGGVSGQRCLFGATHGGDFKAGAGLSVGTNGVSVYDHGANYMPALAVYEGPVGTGFTIISVNYSNKQPFLYWQSNLASAGVASPRAIVTAPVEIGSGAYGAFSGDVAEILVYDRALSETERRSIEEGLARKYALRLPAPLHTNFKLDADGEPLLLTRTDGVRADEFPPVFLPLEVSFGRQPDGGQTGFFFADPTPAAPNGTPGLTELLQAPQFSQAAGFHTNNFQLTLSVTNQGAAIHYTLDGSDPTESPPLFTGSILITNRTPAPNNLSLIPTVPSGYQPPA